MSTQTLRKREREKHKATQSNTKQHNTTQDLRQFFPKEKAALRWDSKCVFIANIVCGAAFDSPTHDDISVIKMARQDEKRGL